MDERKESTMHGGIDTDPVTLTRFILAEQHKHPEASGDLTIMMSSIQLACKTIATAVRKAGIAGLYGLQGSVNVQGEDVKKLDIVANENFINALKVCWAVSEACGLPRQQPTRCSRSWDVCFPVLAQGQRDGV